MKKQYSQPAIELMDLSSVNIMAGSVQIRSRRRIGLSTDDNDWTTDQDDSSKRSYNFWD